MAYVRSFIRNKRGRKSRRIRKMRKSNYSYGKIKNNKSIKNLLLYKYTF
jgi:hypothetical protein